MEGKREQLRSKRKRNIREKQQGQVRNKIREKKNNKTATGRVYIQEDKEHDTRKEK